MKLDKKILLRVSTFGVLTVTVLLFLNSFFQPVWTKWNNYYSTKGFYEEPKNTIETLFLGASVTQSSLSPMEMYSEYGINAYNLGTEQQPMLGSYYWLREVYDYHSETLKTVVLDVSALRSTSKESFYHKCFDNMRLSKNKIQAAYEYKKGNVMSTISFLTPLISYHSRWNSLDETDFTKFTWDPNTGTRGYYYLKNTHINKIGYEELAVKCPVLDENAVLKEPLLEDSLKYFDRIINFCEEKGLNFVLIKTSASNWNSALHNAVQKVADQYGIEFLDFNFDPLYGVNGYLHGFDNNDAQHLNYFGAKKLSKWLGNYLVENCGATDIRDNPKYDFMKKEYEEYSTRVVEHSNLISTNSFTEYIECAFKGNNTVLFSVKENAFGALSDKEKEFLRENGLEKLADIGRNDSYIGVFENGKVTYEKVSKDGEKDKPIKYRNVLAGTDISYVIESGGKNSGNIGDIYIDGNNESEADKGINIVVYNHDLEEVYNAASFNTSSTTERNRYGVYNMSLMLDEEAQKKNYSPTSIEGRIFIYKNQVDNIREYEKLRLEVGDNSLFSYFEKYWRDGISVMISLNDNADKALTEKDRENFKKFGLEELAKLKNNDSYAAYIKDGKVMKEVRSNDSKVEIKDFPNVYIKSGSKGVGKTSSIKVNNIERSVKGRGLNIVFYDTELDRIIKSVSFDTWAEPITYR